MLSIWQSQSFSQKSDIVIIGAGLTGLLTAIQLKRNAPALKVIVLEKGLYPEGASAKNAGFACYGSVSEILDDIRNEGESKAYSRVIERYEGLQLLFDLVNPQWVDLTTKGGVEVFSFEDQNIQQDSLDAIPDINKNLGKDLGFNPFSIGLNNFGLNALDQNIAIKNEGVLHSGKLLKVLTQQALEKGITIHYNCEVLHIDKGVKEWLVQTHLHQFIGAKVLLATNGFTNKLIPEIDIVPARGQIILTSKIADLKLDRSFHMHQGYYYFRNFEGALLLGGGRHVDKENENTTSQEITSIIQNDLERVLREYILPGQQFEIVQRWSGTMAFGAKNEKEPLIYEHTSGYYIAARLGGMGVAMSALVAKKAANLLLN
jgi:glycine/D-amino acid oxidase-like deaminating enzyme